MKFIPKNYQQWLLFAALSLVSSVIISIPISIKFYHESLVSTEGSFHSFRVFVEVLSVFIVQYLITLFLLSMGRFGLIVWTLFFVISLLVAYLFVSFGKNIDAWVISDMLENINGLTFEYLSIKSAVLILAIGIIFGFLARMAQSGKRSFKSKAFIVTHSVLISILLLVNFSDDFLMKKVRRNYPPLSVISSISKYVKIRKEIDIEIKNSRSLDLINSHSFEYNHNDAKPKTIVLIIGESLRNDYFYEMMPQFSSRLRNNKNSIFFNDVRSCETSTRKSIPCLLTNVDHRNWADFLSSINMIDVFEKLNFDTYWIDNQSLYGYFDSTYSFLAKSSDVVIEEKFINLDRKKYNNYDEDLLPYIKKAAGQVTKNDKFILIHLLGSHWHLELRYPEEYAVFSPRCSIKSDAASCSNQEIKNSYKNSVVYSFKVLEDIIDVFSDQNSLVLFTPDHGVSLGEGGKIGNASDKNPIEQISVPLFVWYSDDFKKQNEDLIKGLVKNSNKKITHEYVFHSVLGCSGIKSDVVLKKNNLCSN